MKNTIIVEREFVGKYSQRGTLSQYEFSCYESKINFLLFIIGVSVSTQSRNTICSLKKLIITHSDNWTRIFQRYLHLILKY